jgi:hypothetical protein
VKHEPRKAPHVSFGPGKAAHPTTAGPKGSRYIRMGGEIVSSRKGGGSGAAEVFSGIHEPVGQGGGVSSAEAGTVGGSAGDRVGASAEARIGFDD